MKKFLLSALALGLVISVSAQTPRHVVKTTGNTAKLEAAKIESPAATSTVVKNMIKKASTASNAKLFTVSVDSIGAAGNPLGLYNGGRTALWVDPNLNSVMFTHREVTPSGTISYDFSTDGGNTFTTNFITFHNAYNGARYPQGVIYNPSGNTDPANAFAVTCSALRDGSNPGGGGDWGGYALSTQAFGAATPNTEDTIHTVGAFKQAIPEAMHINPVSGKVWVIEPALTGALNNGYTDSLIINQGVYNGTTHNFEYTQSLLYAPMSLMNTGKKATVTNTRIAFAPDGQKGWISMVSHNDFTLVPDSCFYPIFYKTTDGGATWTGPINVPLYDIDVIKNFISDADLAIALGHAVTPTTRDSLLYTTGFDGDMAVDANGNPYLAIDISLGVGQWSIATRPGLFGMFAIFSTDGGTTWDAKQMCFLETFRATFGVGTTTEISEDNRPQISTDYAGTKMFVSWLDTDTITFGSADGNLYPDIHIRGIDCATGHMTAATDVTAGTLGDGQSYMGTAPYYVFKNGTSYEIPFVYQVFDPADATTQAQFFYVKGFTFTDADFVGINEVSDNINFVSQNYPNPFNENTTIIVGLTKPCHLNVSVINMLGQSVSEINMGNVASGNHTITIDGSKLTSGIYFYTVKAGESVVTHKMIVE